MSSAFDTSLGQALQKRHEDKLYRFRKQLDAAQQPEVIVEGEKLVSFCSNDYLGLANHPEVNKAFVAGIERYGSGSGASHLVSGHTKAHEALEEALAEFTGRDRALLFSSGYQANTGILNCLAGKNDRVLQDRLNHASLLDGGLQSGAMFSRYAHNDPRALDTLLERTAVTGKTFIVTDGVFSMDGDLAPLPRLKAVAARHDAVLMVDDAHGFGCLGQQGGGSMAYWAEQAEARNQAVITQDECPILVGTLGKAFGTAGAFVAGSEALIETLIQFCRPYIYTTAQPAALACATLKSLQILQRDSERREWLNALIRDFRKQAGTLGLTLTDSITPIQSVLLGSEEKALKASQLLKEQGLQVTAIRPPTVPRGTARLRITFSASHTREQFCQLTAALESVAELASQ